MGLVVPFIFKTKYSDFYTDFEARNKMATIVAGTLNPKYPKEGRDAGIEGRAVVNVLIDADGKPLEYEILKSLGSSAFDKAAIDAAVSATYTPALENGKPVKVWQAIPIDFKLNKDTLNQTSKKLDK